MPAISPAGQAESRAINCRSSRISRVQLTLDHVRVKLAAGLSVSCRKGASVIANSLRLELICRVLLGLLLLLGTNSATAQETWEAGVARVKITPSQPQWMSGYASRTRPAEGKLHDLWAKALAIQDPAGHKAVLVTIDIVGLDRSTSLAVRRAVASKYGLGCDQIALNCSHTHCGPVIGRNLEGIFFLDESQWQRIDEYTVWLQDRLLQVVGEALGRLAPAALAWGQGQADFAVNRRNNKHDAVPELRQRGELRGPVDHSVPVLRVIDAKNDKQVIAVVFGYACHPTKLTRYYRWCGDYAGFAQIHVESACPGAIAMFWQGCAGDQTPWPRAGADIVKTEAVGRQLADAVGKVLSDSSTPMMQLSGRLVTRYAEIPLALDLPPERDELVKRSRSKNRFEAWWAKRLMEKIDSGTEPLRSYPYPVQFWRLGSQVTFVMLGGEVVVDYAVRLKRELTGQVWVAGYTNDVMAYIPSRRVLHEGGYEGAQAMMYYGFPSTWSPEVEEAIVRQVLTQAKSSGLKPASTGPQLPMVP